MKKPSRAFWPVLLCFLAATTLVPRALRADPAPTPVDISAVKQNFRWLAHPTLGYIVVPNNIDDDLMFYSLDGTTFYQQRMFNRHVSGDTDWSIGFWSPRAAIGLADGGRITREEATGKITLRCGKATEEWTLMAAADSDKLLASAKFVSRLWARQAHFLARDDKGVYVYIDRLREAHGGKGYRIFRGPKGGMKALKMTNVVSDSEGEIFSTKGGELRLISAATEASWIARKKATKLVIVPVEENAAMIYSELGVYPGNLGTPCDAVAAR